MNLTKFNNINLFEAGKNFFEQLKVALKTKTEQSIPAKGILKDQFKDVPIFNSIKETFFLGLIDNSVLSDTSSIFESDGLSLDESLNKVNEQYDGIMVFAVKLENYYPTRTEIANLVRAFNKSSKKVPVIVLLSYENNGNSFLTFSTTERTKYLQNWREGEKLGKVSMLKDINIRQPHTGHLKILQDLELKPDVRTFDALYKQWREVFDIQLLNKRFYQEIANWFEWAVKNVKFPNDIKDDKDDEKFNNENIIRLLTRIIFIWFLKEKNLIPEIIFNEEKLYSIVKDFGNKDANNYYKAILQNLFFATLNREVDKRDFATDGKFHENTEHYGIKNLFRYSSSFKIEQTEVKNIFQKVPFVNGGLFDCLDSNDEIKINENGKTKYKVLYYDGFSRNPQKQAQVPDFLFFNSNINGKGLFNILNGYKFTVAENTPVEEEIALDPELLGRIFENLLASYNEESKTTARKATGSFYTPREIVNYMVDESIMEYLQGKLENLPP
nr:type II restriction endonuclease [Candidatus Kapabacteria bacterium]